MLRLYSRSGCHLCEDMIAALDILRGECDFSFEVIDVDADPGLRAKYDEWVPVLVDPAGAALCRFILDVAKVREFLGAIR